MKNNKRIFILGCIFIFSLNILLGFTKDPTAKIVKKDIDIIQNIVNSDVSFKETVQDNDVFSVIYKDDYKYEDTSYLYFMNPDKNFIEGIFPQPDTATNSTRTIDTSSSTIIFNSMQDMYEFMQNNMKNYIKGKLSVNYLGGNDNIGYTYDIIETVNGIETGTKASLILDSTNALISAVFLEGNYDRVAALNPEAFLTEQDAYDYALKYINSISDESIIINTNDIANNKLAKIETFKNNTYWHLFFGTISETGYPNVYDITLDALTGEILTVNSAVY